MAVRLERFMLRNLNSRVADVIQLVSDQSVWIEEALPGMDKRYSTYYDACLNYARQSTARDVTSLLVLNEEDRLIGLAAATPRLRIAAPGNSERWTRATSIDYTLLYESTADEHREAGRALVEFSAEHMYTEHFSNTSICDDSNGVLDVTPVRRRYYSNQVMTAVGQHQINQPVGLIHELEPLASPAQFEVVGAGQKPSEPFKDGAMLQLYYKEFPLAA